MPKDAGYMDDCLSLVGRQPIMNAVEELVAYELLFRATPSAISSALFQDHKQATSNVIVNTLSTFGIKEILGGHRGFVNVDGEMLMSDWVKLLPASMIGLEILEHTEITPELIESCLRLKTMGFALALDDHRYDRKFEPLYNGIVDIVKFDLHLTPLDQLYQEVELLRNYPVKILAEKVDRRDVYLRCRRMGFDLFQGYFFARPTLMQKRRIEASITILFELLQKLSCDSSFEDIEHVFKKSPALTYKLLCLVNSVAYGMRDKIRTVWHAISIIGLEQLKRWVQLAIFAADNDNCDANPLIHMVAVRSSLMEGLALLHPSLTSLKYAGEKAFMTGTLSILTDLYEIGVNEITVNLNLSDAIVEALTDRTGHFGDLLNVAEMIEQTRLDEAFLHLDRIGIAPDAALECQKRAFAWQNSLR